MLIPRDLFRDLPISRKLLLTAVIPVLAVLVLSVVTYQSVETFSEDEEQLNTTYLVQRKTSEYLRLVLELQSGFRGFVLTGQEQFLRPYLSAHDRILIVGDVLEEMIQGPEGFQVFHETRQLVDTLISDKDRLIETYRSGKHEEAIDYVEQGHGRALLIEIREHMSTFERLEQDRLGNLLTKLARDRSTMMSVILWGGLLALGLLVLTLQLIARSITDPLGKLAKAVAASPAGVVPEVPLLTRTDEIGALSQVMHAMSGQVRAHLAKVEQSEAALRAVNQHLLLSESKYRSLVDHAPFGIYATAGVTPVFSNRYNLLLAGFDPESLSGRSVGEHLDFWQAVYPDDREAALAEFREAVQHSRPFERVFRFVHPDGEIRKVLSRAIPIRDASGEVAIFQGFNVDITALDQMQAQLTRSERLATLGQVAAGIAHEIRNPLVGIGSTAAMLLEDNADPDERRADLEVILQETRRLDRIVNQIIDYARPRAFSPTLFSMEELIKETLALLAEPLNKKTIKTDVFVHPNLSRIEADRDQIKQVFLNVMYNAVDAMKMGGLLQITAFDTVREQVPGLTLKIIDNGVGIPPADLRHIFEPFFTTGKHHGTGLGLAICRNIVDLHQGEIDVSSEPGRGTSVRVWLPLKPTSQAMLL
jgi:PAS domain S-box-containing protein